MCKAKLTYYLFLEITFGRLPSITQLIFSVKEGNFPHDSYFGLFKPIFGSTSCRLHELLNLVGWGRRKHEGSIRAG